MRGRGEPGRLLAGCFAKPLALRNVGGEMVDSGGQGGGIAGRDDDAGGSGEFCHVGYVGGDHW